MAEKSALATVSLSGSRHWAFGKNRRFMVCEKMVVDLVADLVVRRRGCKPSEERTSGKSERRLEIHFRAEKRVAGRE